MGGRYECEGSMLTPCRRETPVPELDVGVLAAACTSYPGRDFTGAELRSARERWNLPHSVFAALVGVAPGSVLSHERHGTSRALKKSDRARRLVAFMQDFAKNNTDGSSAIAA